MKSRRNERGQTVKLLVDKPATAARLEQQNAESSVMKGTNETL